MRTRILWWEIPYLFRPGGRLSSTAETPAREDARNYAKSCGVTASVLEGLKGELPPDFKLDSRFIDGLNRKSVALVRLYAAGKLPGNFLEIMSCKGGCVGGPCSLHS